MLLMTNLLQWQIWEKKKTIKSPLYLFQIWQQFNGELKYPLRRQVGIMKFDIHTSNNNFNLRVSKGVSKYKINDNTSKYLTIISSLNLQMSKEKDKVVELVP